MNGLGSQSTSCIRSPPRVPVALGTSRQLEHHNTEPTLSAGHHQKYSKEGTGKVSGDSVDGSGIPLWKRNLLKRKQEATIVCLVFKVGITDSCKWVCLPY